MIEVEKTDIVKENKPKKETIIKVEKEEKKETQLTMSDFFEEFKI